jgi:hypothetical protein
MLAAAIPAASADDWCSDDPPVRVVTPGGHTVVVRVTDSALGSQHLGALRAATYSYTVAPAKAGTATLVTLTVNVPNDAFGVRFPTRSVVSTAADEHSKKYDVYSDRYGVAGTAIVHSFVLNVP